MKLECVNYRNKSQNFAEKFKDSKFLWNLKYFYFLSILQRDAGIVNFLMCYNSTKQVFVVLIDNFIFSSIVSCIKFPQNIH
jgi:hypothetical protein